MKLKIDGNDVDLCKSCEKNYEACDSYDADYFYGDQDNVCCCARYVPIVSRVDNPTGDET